MDEARTHGSLWMRLGLMAARLKIFTPSTFKPLVLYGPLE